MNTTKEPLRHVRLENGFTLRTWDTGKTRNGRTLIAYELRKPAGAVLFSGSDFCCSPLHADDSDEALRALLGFLLLRPGDVDRDHFASYTADQLVFANSQNCELLGFIYSSETVGTENEGELEDIDEDEQEGGQ